MKLRLTIRDLDATDLHDLDWSGGSEHLKAIADALQASYSGDVGLVTIALPNKRLVALGGVDFRQSPGLGELWMLSVHETFQSLGLGSKLIGALEAKVRERGLSTARLGVEHDNPRALALYCRLGYREVGTRLDGWPEGGGRRYITVCTILERGL